MLDNLAAYLYGTERPDNSNASAPGHIGDNAKHHIYYYSKAYRLFSNPYLTSKYWPSAWGVLGKKNRCGARLLTCVVEVVALANDKVLLLPAEEKA